MKNDTNTSCSCGCSEVQETTSAQTPATMPKERWIQPRWEGADTEDAYTVSVQTPGVPKEGISVTAEHSKLEVIARRPTPDASLKAQICEFGRDSGYRLAFVVDNSLDTADIKAAYADGILSLTIPKHKAAKRQNIAIA
ncbi:MAG: Hsp20/alpha crystallin family protein [Puniceicoccales bacterium]|jgi:HSP20 family protein|nr:Hsp20/alpha crystallin family protein [Puniceicoccales bacterium]